MEKIRLGSKLWTVIIVFLLTGFIFNGISAASLYYAGYYLKDSGNKTILFAGICLITRVSYTFNYDIFYNYILQIYVNKKLIKNLGFAIHKMNDMSMKHYANNIGSGQYLSAIFQNFYGPFYFATQQIYYLADVILSLLLNLGFFFFFNWILGIIGLLIIAIFSLIPLVFYKKWINYRNQVNDKTNNWFEKMANLFKLFNFYYFHHQTNKIIDKNQDEYKQVGMLHKKLENFGILYSSVIRFVLVTSQIAFYLISGFTLINVVNDANKIIGLSFFSIGNLVNFLYTAESFSATFSNFFTQKNSYAKFWTFSHGDDYPEDQLNHYEKPFESINIQGLSFNYPNKPALFQNFNLTIEKSKKYLFVGNNGSGKSTLTKLLTGFERDYSGNILFNNDIQVKELKQESLCHYFNWVTNKNILLDDTLRNNLTLYKNDISDDQIKSSLATMNLSELDQLDHVYEEGKNGLSVGQVQRLDIARCLLEPKPILILDEALSNVDVVNQEKILNHFLEQKDLTLIVITHHLTSEWQQKFDQVVQL